ncbi:pyroglutamyl-peptidase I [Aeromonas sp. FDAARGOS 1415]|uniref:pyroglutamyl-peptidase I n=1 Tax=Aeromonas TaxID=642 RepID=UPI001C22287E|nr:pyroglutamyl-peptidase I [Aeromonas sp. FDAARGOS 1415]QXB54737.1 pyroglutamyl-peptidase I [Aeromonas sp. FDAARGOS 1415]
MKTILLTGFEPFGGEPLNPSWEAVRQLDGQRRGDHQIRAVRLSCAFGQALTELKAALAQHQPVLVLAVGQAGGRSELSLERIAINLDDARIPDNAGAQPIDSPIVAEGPAAYFTTLPIKAMVAALREAGLPAAVSHSAGTYVCNHLFYGLMHEIERDRPGCRGGFLHIPYLPGQAVRHPAGTPSMSLSQIVHGLEVALDAALHHERDLPITGGATH